MHKHKNGMEKNMPKGDKTGPQGLGSKTGRAAGYCAGYSVPGYMNPMRGCGRGFGRGFGRRRGGGFGIRRFSYLQPFVVQPDYQPIDQPQTLQQEIATLENYQKSLEVEKTNLDQEMEGVKARLKQLKTSTTQEK